MVASVPLLTIAVLPILCDGNAYGYFDCGGREYNDDAYVKSHGYSWPKEFFENEIKHRKATHFYHQRQYVDKESKQPFCLLDGVEDKFKKDRKSGALRMQETKDLLDPFMQSTKVDGGLVILMDLAYTKPPTRDTIANTLCGIDRVNLLSRTVVYYGDPQVDVSYLESLRAGFPAAHIIHDKHILRASRNLNPIGNKWRWIPVLVLLEHGFTVLHMDPDVQLIKDPRPMFQQFEDADVVSAYESCLEFNGGFNLWRPTERTQKMLQAHLAIYPPRRYWVVDGGRNISLHLDAGDQWALACSVAYGVVHHDLQMRVLVHDLIAFHWHPIATFFQKHCYETSLDTTVKKYPYVMHSSNAGQDNRQVKMEFAGLWELHSTKGWPKGFKPTCRVNHDPSERCRLGFDVVPKGEVVKFFHDLWTPPKNVKLMQSPDRTRHLVMMPAGKPPPPSKGGDGRRRTPNARPDAIATQPQTPPQTAPRTALEAAAQQVVDAAVAISAGEDQMVQAGSRIKWTPPQEFAILSQSGLALVSLVIVLFVSRRSCFGKRGR